MLRLGLSRRELCHASDPAGRGRVGRRNHRAVQFVRQGHPLGHPIRSVYERWPAAEVARQHDPLIGRLEAPHQLVRVGPAELEDALARVADRKDPCVRPAPEFIVEQPLDGRAVLPIICCIF